MTEFNFLVTDLLGTKLKTPKGEQIGVVQNVMINPETGTIVFIFLCFANTLGKEHRTFAIPGNQLKIKKETNAFFEIELDKLLEASTFVMDGEPDFEIYTQNPSLHELHIRKDRYEPAYLR